MKVQSDFISNLDSIYDTVPNPFRVGDIVYLNGEGDKRGRIAFIGKVHFTNGELIGIDLDNPVGFHDGKYRGSRYFITKDNHGVFARMCFISRYPWIPATNDAIKSGLYRPSDYTLPKSRFYREGSPLSLTGSMSRSPSPAPSSSSSSRSKSDNDSPFVGDRVIIRSAVGDARTGVLRYLGRVEFSSGIWAGVELDGPWGKNDGTVLGRNYFSCPKSYGIFVPSARVVSSPLNTSPFWKWPSYRYRTKDGTVHRFYSASPRSIYFDDVY